MKGHGGFVRLRRPTLIEMEAGLVGGLALTSTVPGLANLGARACRLLH